MTQREQDSIVRTWLCEPMPVDVAESIHRLAGSDDVQRIAVMPDVHLSHDVCVGTVLATGQLLYPNAVGGDIGCGMATMAFDADADVLADERIAAEMLSRLCSVVPGNRHRCATM